MFYSLSKGMAQVDSFDAAETVAGHLTYSQLEQIREKIDFPEPLMENCRNVNDSFRSGVEVHDRYTFTELRIVDTSDEHKKQDCVALYITKNLLLIIDVDDADGSTKEKFVKAMNRYSAETVSLEKLIFAFFDALIASDSLYIERMGNDLTKMEEDVFQDNTDDTFNQQLLNYKKRFLSLHNYYEQILDITQALDENENDILNEDSLIYISNIDGKVTRLREDVDSLNSNVVHLQDAYTSFMDSKMNRSMKLLTVITTIFFPLTIIVGWYGMNFESMKEFKWRFGYLYVIILSVTVIAVFTGIAKRKKWF